jgi:hypothetical protein
MLLIPPTTDYHQVVSDLLWNVITLLIKGLYELTDITCVVDTFHGTEIKFNRRPVRVGLGPWKFSDSSPCGY